jgi:hypothetical protein
LTGPWLRAKLARVLDGPGTGAVVVDLSAVTFLGSTGVAVLADAHWQATEMRPFESTGITQMLPTYDTLDAAMQ